MSDAKLGSGVSSDATTESSLPEILNAHARMETQCGEIYVQFAATFGQYPELRRMRTLMALEEGGHAAVVRAVNRGLLSGVLKARSLILPLEYLDSLSMQLKGYQEQAQAEISLDRALRHLRTGMF
jgi:hypothetical protein